MTWLLAAEGGIPPLILITFGFVGGLLVGWNLFPQPEWLAKKFKRKKGTSR